MFCTQCGTELSSNTNFCSHCGRATASGLAYRSRERLTRYMPDKKIAGVCAGVAKYFDVDVTLVRLLWLVAIFFPIPGGLIAYALAWMILPKEYGIPYAPVTDVRPGVA